MVIRHNFLPPRFQSGRPIHRANQLILNASLGITTLIDLRSKL